MNRGISVNSNIHFGKPCIAGTRIPVQSILELVAEGFSFEQITRGYYPNVEVGDIQACIRFAIDIVASEDIHIANEAA